MLLGTDSHYYPCMSYLGYIPQSENANKYMSLYSVPFYLDGLWTVLYGFGSWSGFYAWALDLAVLPSTGTGE